jgi:hypothetical protein
MVVAAVHRIGAVVGRLDQPGVARAKPQLRAGGHVPCRRWRSGPAWLAAGRRGRASGRREFAMDRRSRLSETGPDQTGGVRARAGPAPCPKHAWPRRAGFRRRGSGRRHGSSPARLNGMTSAPSLATSACRWASAACAGTITMTSAASAPCRRTARPLRRDRRGDRAVPLQGRRHPRRLRRGTDRPGRAPRLVRRDRAQGPQRWLLATRRPRSCARLASAASRPAMIDCRRVEKSAPDTPASLGCRTRSASFSSKALILRPMMAKA